MGAGPTSPLKTRPIRILLAWQAAVTCALAGVAGLWAGWDAAVSAALGGAINLVANFVYALMGGIVRPTSVVGALLLIFRAEAFKVVLIFVSMLLVLMLYRDLVAFPFIGAFIVTTLLFGIALRVRD
jgi:F0F1-type ATP synthase assembly protein I